MIVAGGDFIGLILGGGSLVGIAYCVARLIAAWSVRKFPALPVYGDVVNLPPEAKAAGSRIRAGGTEPSMAARAQRTILDRTHDGNRPTR